MALFKNLNYNYVSLLFWPRFIDKTSHIKIIFESIWRVQMKWLDICRWMVFIVDKSTCRLNYLLVELRESIQCITQVALKHFFTWQRSISWIMLCNFRAIVRKTGKWAPYNSWLTRTEIIAQHQVQVVCTYKIDMQGFFVIPGPSSKHH